MSRILVTGARGFIGRALLPRLLQPGVEVHAVSSRLHPPEPAVTWHQCDLLEAAAVARLVRSVRPEQLVHLAWTTEHGKYWESPQNEAWLAASLALFEEFQRQGGRRAVMIGTCAEYDWTAGHCVEATTPLKPTTPYATAKLQLCTRLEPQARAAGVQFAWARLFHLFGPHESEQRLVPHVTRALLCGQPAQCSAGTQVRDYSYTGDVAAALADLLASDFVGAINVASGEARTVRSVVQAIADRVGGATLLQFGTAAPRAGDPPVLTADVTRLRSLPQRTPRLGFDRALDETIAWWRQRLAAGKVLHA